VEEGYEVHVNTACVPATYTRKNGKAVPVRIDHHGTFFRRLRRRKCSKNILSFIELRRHYPAQHRIYNNGQPACTLDTGYSEKGKG
jgi:hypothetical protein